MSSRVVVVAMLLLLAQVGTTQSAAGNPCCNNPTALNFEATCAVPTNSICFYAACHNQCQNGGSCAKTGAVAVNHGAVCTCITAVLCGKVGYRGDVCQTKYVLQKGCMQPTALNFDSQCTVPTNGACTFNKVNCVGAWGEYGACSKTCGAGTKTGTYKVSVPAKSGGKACAQAAGATRSATCEIKKCPIDCVGRNGGWAACSKTCGGGKQTGKYIVTTKAQYGGKACAKKAGEPVIRTCGTQPCPVNCIGSYGAWSACSTTCGAGSRTASYAVTINAANGGTACPPSIKSQPCPYADPPVAGHPHCAVNCVGAYGDFGACSKTCAGGMQVSKFVISIKAAYGGVPCANNGQSKSLPCNAQPCPVDCKGSYSAFTPCSKTCGTGTKTQAYTVTTPAANNGKACPFKDGSVAPAVTCTVASCPVNCVGKYGAWGACSVKCGTGAQTAMFKVTIPESSGGTACSAVNGATASQACTGAPCGSDGTCTAGACVCNDGWSGDHCGNKIDFCTVTRGPLAGSMTRCDSEGTLKCNSVGATWTSCVCKKNYFGPRCSQHDANDNCKAQQALGHSPCKNGGSCVDQFKRYTCECTGAALGYTGQFCEKLPAVGSQTFSKLCHRPGCLNTTRTAQGCASNPFGACTCKAGWVGNKCDQCSPSAYGKPSGKTPCTPCNCNVYSARSDGRSETNGSYSKVPRNWKATAKAAGMQVTGVTFGWGAVDSVCDPNGVCHQRHLGCFPGWAGKRCQKCAPGYYGDPLSWAGGCLPCPAGSSGPGGTAGQATCAICAKDTFSKKAAAACTKCHKKTETSVGSDPFDHTKCEPVDCGEIKVPKHGKVKCNGNSFGQGAVCTVTCTQLLYVHAGAKKSTCLHSGLWSGSGHHQCIPLWGDKHIYWFLVAAASSFACLWCCSCALACRAKRMKGNYVNSIRSGLMDNRGGGSSASIYDWAV